jgi:hypothetical protein
VAQAVDGTSGRAQESQRAAQELAEITTRLGKLTAQFKIERRDRRIDRALPVQLTATDVSGHSVHQTVMTIDISLRGALLQGVAGALKTGDIISLARSHKKEQFRVVWVGAKKAATSGQMGVAPVDPNSSFWDDALQEMPESEYEADTAPSDRSWAAHA